MERTGKRFTWLWFALPFLLLLGAGYYLYATVLRTPTVPSPAPHAGPPAAAPGAAVIKAPIPISPAERKPPGGPQAESRCEQLQGSLVDFFRYLDGKKYVQHLGAGADTYQRFQRILKRVASRVPIPAGEGIDPRITVENVYHLFRVLDRQDLRLIKDVIRNEPDTLEVNLRLLYEWLVAQGGCQEAADYRPSMKALYHYAGFFLNTIGGRAYLFRQAPALRLLVSHYSLLILHEADLKGRNTYGIDVLPFIGPLRKEILRYPDLHFQADYIAGLDRLESHYLARR